MSRRNYSTTDSVTPHTEQLVRILIQVGEDRITAKKPLVDSFTSTSAKLKKNMDRQEFEKILAQETTQKLSTSDFYEIE